MTNPHLPPEILDYILDTLYDEPKTLRDCCVVAKSWIPRTRKHLFADVNFSLPKDLESWKKAFPDPSNSPACYTHTLSVKFPQVITAEDATDGGWIRPFSRVVRLDVDTRTPNLSDSEVSLSPFHGFSPILKSLHLASSNLPYSQIFGLIHSLPLLEDLKLVVYGSINDDDLHVDRTPTATQPSSSPAFTGTLELILPQGMGPAARRLLDLPSGLHFRKLRISWFKEEEFRWVNALVMKCSDNLERLSVMRLPFAGLPHALIDLSKATRLQDVEFRCGKLKVEWITMTLRTITSKHRDLQTILIRIFYKFSLEGSGASIRQTAGETAYREWLDLDRLLVQLWESRLIRPKVKYTCTSENGWKEAIDGVSCLLPEVTKRRIVGLVGYYPQQ